MRTSINRVFVVSFLIGTMFLFGCQKELDKYYEIPDWLKGNAWEYLESQGNYTQFLQAVELTGYKDLVGGKGIITVMAPSDDAFAAYLTKKGYTSVNDIPSEELVKLVGYHLVYYSFSKEQFANYQPNGSGSENPLETGLYYKHRTKALNPITTEIDPVTEKEVKVIHKELFIPVLSENLFATKHIDAKSNYEYFFNGSTWAGDDGGFNIASASVNQYAVVTDNGYLYEIDRVLEPLETIHQSLKNQGNFSDFLSMYDKFSDYWYDEEATRNYGNGDSLFIHKHIALPQIASEWPYNGEGNLPDYANLAALSKDAFSVYVPTNEAISSFYTDFWSSSYSSIDSVYFIQIAYLLDNHVFSGSIVFPEEIQNGSAFTKYGTPVAFDPNNDVDISQICANGAYYGLNSVQIPVMFKSVTGPAFKTPDYRMFLFMMDYTDMVQPLSSNSINYTIFYPSDATIVKSGYYDLNIQYYNPMPKKYDDDIIQILDGQWVNLSRGSMLGFINDHIATDILTEVAGIKVYKTRSNLNYLYVKDNAVASTRMYNENLGFSPIEKIEGEWDNGSAYKIDTLLLKNSNPFKAEITSADEYDFLSEFTEFSRLLSKAGLLPLNNPLDFIVGNYMVFIPSNSAILHARTGAIPDDAEQLAEYLKYYFVPLSTNFLSDYLFPGTGFSGELKTYQRSASTTPTIKISDKGNKLHLVSPQGEANVVSVIPKVYADGAAYLIDGLIQP